MRQLSKCALSLAILAAALFGGSGAFAAGSNEPVQGNTVTQQAPVSVITTEQMKKNEALLPAQSTKKRVIPFKRRKPDNNSSTAPRSSLLPAPRMPSQSSVVKAPTLLTSFAGMDLLGNTSQAVPPDTMGAAGPTYLMSIVNGGVAYYNKATGAVSGHITDTTFWSSLGGGPGQPADGVFDPKVFYDQYLGRFIVVELAQGSASYNSYILVGISNSSDPTGSWTLHAIRADLDNGTTPTTYWADFPQVGMDANNLYVNVNMFDGGGSFHYIKMYSIPKTQLQSTASTITYTEFKNNNNVDFTVQPCVTFGSGQQIYFVGEDYTGGGNHTDSPQSEAASSPSYLKLFTITNNAWTPLGDILVNSYPVVDSLPGAPQLGMSQTIATNDTRMLNAVCRGGYLWATHTVSNAAAAKTEVAWYQIDPSKASLTLASAGAPVQEGRVSDTNMFYYFPSIAVNASGDAAIGFSGSSSTTYAGGYYTARLSADSAGTTQTVAQLVAGAAPYYVTWSTDNRWGDYSATCVDPNDDTTFWTIQEYAKGSANWGTYWGSFSTSTASQYTLTVTMNGTGAGTVTPMSGTIKWNGLTGAATYTTGTSVVLTAAAGAGSTFSSWSGCDNASGSQCTVAMTAARSVTATFSSSTPNTAILTVTKTGTGTGTVTASSGTISWSGNTGTAAITLGSSAVLTAAASSGSTFSSWSGCDSSSGSQCTVAMSSAKSVTAKFTLSSTNIRGDFLGNGNADILWRNTYNGGNLIWTMLSTTPTSILGLPGADVSWEIVGTADFTSNGYPAILWRHKSLGFNAIWTTKSGAVTNAISFPSCSDTTWKIVGTGDFDGDGYPDILWRNSVTGNVAIWLMKGIAYKSAIALPTVSDLSWQIVGTGDFNGDGNLDIVWRNNVTGDNVVWLMLGVTFSSAQSLPSVSDTSWRIAAISDFNGDGYPDIVWSNSYTGASWIWLMNGTAYSSAAQLPTVSETTWQIVGPR